MLTQRGCGPRRQGWTESNWGGKREEGHCSSSTEARQVPRAQSQLAVHRGRPQRPVHCDAQVPDPGAAGPGPGVAPSPSQTPPRTLQAVSPASPFTPQQTGWGGGESGSCRGSQSRSGRARVQAHPCTQQPLASTCSVPGPWRPGENALPAVALCPTFFLPLPPPGHRPSAVMLLRGL